VDRQVLTEKLESLRRCVGRVQEKCPATVDDLLEDIDLQDILVINLSRAVQLSVDIAAHVLAESGVPAPETMGAAFDALARADVIAEALAVRLRKAVGFRNIAVHNYEAIDWRIVFSIAHNHLSDFEKFAAAITRQLK